MSARNPANRLAKLTLKLISNDLKLIRELQNDPNRQNRPRPGVYSLVLSRYFGVLMNHKTTTEKLENAQRKALKKLSEKQLRALAGVPEKVTTRNEKPIQDKEIPESQKDLGSEIEEGWPKAA